MRLKELLVRNQPPSGWPLRIVISVAVLAYAIAIVGEIIFSQIVDRSPVALVALNPTNKNLILVNGDEYRIAATPYYLVGFFRHLLTDPFYYLLGFWFGDKAINWISRASKTFGKLVEEGQTSLALFAHVMVFLSPVSFVCALAGAVGMKFGRFIAINSLGTITTLIFIRWLGDRFGGGIDSIVELISEYRWQVLVISILLVGFSLFRDSRGSGKSEIEFLKELDSNSETK